METTIYDSLKKAGNDFSNHIALVDGPRRCTYSELLRKTEACASGLAEIGVVKGTHVAIMFPNGIEFVALLYGLFLLGAVPAPLNYRLFGEELSYQICLSGAEVLIYAPEYSKNIADALAVDRGNVRMLAGSPIAECPNIKRVSLESVFYNNGRCLNCAHHVESGEDGLILFTSGSTGYPKAAVKTQGALAAEVALSRKWPGAYTVNDSFLLFNPLFHQGGMSFLFALISAGSKIVLQKSLREADVVRAIQTEHITQMLLLPPSLCERIKECPDRAAIDLSSVRCVTITGGKSAQKDAEDIFSLFPNAKVRGGYGHTENAAILSLLFDREQLAAKPSLAQSVGMPVSGCSIRLLDGNKKPVAQGEVGEAWAKSPAMFSRYIDRESKCEEGWFPTGDRLWQDADGMYYFAGRSKDMIKTGGENVYSIEVERVLEEYPGVRESAVFGIEDEYLDECIAAAIECEKGAEIEPQQLVEYCKSKIASYKKPRAIVFLDSLPRTSTGKIDKTTLSRTYNENHREGMWVLQRHHA